MGLELTWDIMGMGLEFGTHALERMEERGVSREMVFDILGDADTIITAADEHDNTHYVKVEELWADDFEIEVGAMNYGFDLDGILGVNFLIRAGAVVDLTRTEVRPAP